MLKQILSATKVVLLALALSFGLSYALAWTAPTATPPGANVAAPINASNTAQVKTGGLTVGSLTTAGAVTAGSVSTTGLTNTGTLRVTGGAPGLSKVLTSDASGNATWQVPAVGSGDNLGDHTATQALSLGTNNIVATGADVAHGTMTVQGAKAGWAGINFRDAAGTANYSTLMMNAATSGFYNNAHTGWRWYVNDTGSSVQAGTATMNDGYISSGGFYLSNATPHGKQRFTANGTFTVPAGVTKVWVTMSGGGGGGGGSCGGGDYSGGGGGGAHAVIAQQLNVTSGASYAITRGVGGTGGAANSAGTAGGTSSFGALFSTAGGGGGSCAFGPIPGAPGGSGGIAGNGWTGGGSIFGSGGPGAGAAAGGFGGGGAGNLLSFVPAGAGSPGFVLVEW